MFGFGGRDRDHGCEAVNDELMVRALYLEQASTRCLILGFDLLFLSRLEADRLKGMLSRVFDLTAREILLNCSHTHAGPMVGDWGDAQPDPYYMEWLQGTVAAAVRTAVAAAQPVRLLAGRAATRLPVSRRYLQADGIAAWRPAPQGEIYPRIPFCRLETEDGRPVSLLFSVACHPSTIGGFTLSADYPGAACRLLDKALATSGALFLQGCGGDTKACVIADGKPDDTGLATWRQGTAADVDQAGRIVADELLAALDGAQPVPPSAAGLTARLAEVAYPLQKPPAEQAVMVELDSENPVKRAWARRLMAWRRVGLEWPRAAPIQCQELRLAEGLRIVALEGEPVAGYGHLIEQAFPGQIVFPLGYSNGQGMYLECGGPAYQRLPPQADQPVADAKALPTSLKLRRTRRRAGQTARREARPARPRWRHRPPGSGLPEPCRIPCQTQWVVEFERLIIEGFNARARSLESRCQMGEIPGR
jgi:neutral ceramidase